jgi:hypothetical protein
VNLSLARGGEDVGAGDRHDGLAGIGRIMAYGPGPIGKLLKVRILRLKVL